MKKFFAILLAVLLACSLFFGCGAAENDSLKSEIGDAGGMSNDMSKEDMDDTLADSISQSTATAPAAGQKLVRKVWLEAETETMDPLLEEIAARLAELEGYVESRNVYNGSQYSGRRYRTAELTLRIPADKLNQFVSQVSEKANIVSNRETADDITLSYVATESRMKALETEEARLLELLAEAKDMADLLQIENRLTQVRTELEQVKSQLRVMDNKVDYGTLYLTVREVKEYTVVEEPKTVWERIGTGFMKSLQSLGEFFVELFVFVIVALPYLVLIGALVTAAILLLRWGKKKKVRKTEEKQEKE